MTSTTIQNATIQIVLMMVSSNPMSETYSLAMELHIQHAAPLAPSTRQNIFRIGEIPLKANMVKVFVTRCIPI